MASDEEFVEQHWEHIIDCPTGGLMIHDGAQNQKYLFDVSYPTSAEKWHAAAEFTTHEGPRVTQAFNDSLAAALTGTKTADVAMADAQKEADRILKQYK
jgi:sn-glycerol 3-phosphate transport system substrate-binding protein